MDWTNGAYQKTLERLGITETKQISCYLEETNKISSDIARQIWKEIWSTQQPKFRIPNSFEETPAQ